MALNHYNHSKTVRKKGAMLQSLVADLDNSPGISRDHKKVSASKKASGLKNVSTDVASMPVWFYLLHPACKNTNNCPRLGGMRFLRS